MAQPRVGLQRDRAVGIQMVAILEHVAAGEHITRQILQQVHRPHRRRAAGVLTGLGSQTEGQLEAITAGICITALLGVQLGEAVGDVMPVRYRRIRPVHADAIQWIWPPSVYGSAVPK